MNAEQALHSVLICRIHIIRGQIQLDAYPSILVEADENRRDVICDSRCLQRTILIRFRDRCLCESLKDPKDHDEVLDSESQQRQGCIFSKRSYQRLLKASTKLPYASSNARTLPHMRLYTRRRRRSYRGRNSTCELLAINLSAPVPLQIRR